jgi:predicted nucleic acid-binding protein
MNFMNKKIFVDTNVLVYSRDSSEPQKQPQAMAWMKYLWEQKAGRLSFQVLQEFYVSVVFKLNPGLDPETARKDVRALFTWQPLPPDSRVLEEAWVMQDQYGLSWWDALIVSSAQVSNCTYLLTENLQENQNLGHVRVIHPFHTSPESLHLV